VTARLPAGLRALIEDQYGQEGIAMLDSLIASIEAQDAY